MKTSIFFIILLLMMVSNTIYPFLPEELQKKNAIKFFAVLAAVIVLVWGAVQIAQDYNSKIYAHVSINGEILKSKNFPWKIEFSEKEKEGEILVPFRIIDVVNV